ncbi:ribonuclease HII [Bombilactobacillus thymidiniphilus]|uniref:Ribonuclease HII n=1 Tax=Bombilactobacillus thymidiniphilus TaxID=2923363 RepID=A0ABY4PDA4_9LACO|nr:ribonuclease HII [Bombilactobacillus thymidiniphilus]UQS83705.1 ribonuclease HII [Bombilactobacillus thymidiniphilus]
MTSYNWQQLSIPTIKDLLTSTELDDAAWQTLAQDSRRGVQNLVRQHQKQLERTLKAQQSFEQRLQFEKKYWQKGQLVAGIDEVGRGPLAGPVVTAAVVLPPTVDILEINDSKQLSDEKRHQLYPKILSEAVDISIAVGSNQLIDTENIYHATELTMAQSVNNLRVLPQHLLVDAMVVPVNIPQTKLIKGDARSISIGAASIVAKVYRDELMKNYDKVYPGFGFSDNAGYGTKVHLQGLQKLGPCAIHRHSFNPVKQYLK